MKYLRNRLFGWQRQAKLGRRKRNRQRSLWRPMFERLEDRNLLATFTVNSTADTNDGTCDAADCTLREALIASNLTPGVDTINFNIPGAGPHTIQLLTPLPKITDPAVVDATTEPDFAGSPVVELDGSMVGAGGYGLWITAGSTTVRGLAINRFADSGVILQTGNGNTLEGNFIGIGTDGATDLGNNKGVFVLSGNNMIGGTTSAARNVISGNSSYGVWILNAAATGNTIAGNRIGTDAAGNFGRPNSLPGIYIKGASGNTVGGTVAGAGNVISGNNSHGVALHSGAGGNVVQGNLIGTDISGMTALPNATSGVVVLGPNNKIGGTAAGAGNVISGNSQHGVLISGRNSPGSTGNTVAGNRIGTDITGGSALGNTLMGVLIENASGNTVGGTTADAGNEIGFNRNGIRVSGASTNNVIRQNSIFQNTNVGIDLGTDGSTVNDVDDSDSGPNNLQNFPVINSAHINGGNIDINYLVPTNIINSRFPIQVEFFLADVDNQEGETFLGGDLYTTPGGAESASIPLGAAMAGSRILATATDDEGNTSEFSAPATVAAMLQAAGGESSGGDELSPGEFVPILDAAVARLANAGVDPGSLATIEFAIADLPGAALGMAGGNTITLDTSAAGYGWFVDPTPFTDSEFRSDSDLYLRASHRMDVLTVVLHEILHILGHAHTDTAGNILNEMLSTGVRRWPTEDELDFLFADHDLVDAALEENAITGKLAAVAE